MRLMATLLPLCGLLAASPILAQDTSPNERWVQVVPDTGLGIAHFIDMRSIRAGNGYRQVWVKDVPTEPRNGVREMRALYEFNCRQPAMRMLQSVTDFRNGTSQATVGQDGWFPILSEFEDTRNVIHRAVCRAPVR